jgi:hypothetical protein
LKSDIGFSAQADITPQALNACFHYGGILRDGNFHRQMTSRKALALLNEQRQCPLPVKTARLSAFRAAKHSSGNRPQQYIYIFIPPL